MQASLRDPSLSQASLRDQNLVVKWLDFKEHEEEIKSLRERVFVDQQQIDPFIVIHPKDPEGFHLGCFKGDTLISIVSAYCYNGHDSVIEKLKLPTTKEMILQITKRAQLPEYNNTRLAEFLAVMLWKSVYDIIQPEYSFIGLYNEHKKLGLYYSTFGYLFSHILETENGPLSIFLQSKENMPSLYIKIRRICDVNSAIFSDIEFPSFYEHLQQTQRLNSFNIKKHLEENLYTNSLSFKDELPRLIAQSRLIYSTQKHIIDEELPAGNQNMLDLGCGPGVYISMLRTHPKLQNYKFAGLDISPEMILYARFTDRSNIWKYASAYDTEFESERFDVVHSSFLFIHLQSPEIALAEIRRILKPTGILYIVDVIDDTFEGPRIIKKLIQKHTELYKGNRNILNILPQLSLNQQMTLVKTRPITFINDGEEGSPQLRNDVLSLGRINMWAMFAFIAQRKELNDLYYEAEKHYFNTDCKISIQVHTQIYKKLNPN